MTVDCHDYYTLHSSMFCFQGLIDLSKEEERINKQVSFKSQQLKKLQDAAAKPDYSEKVPLEVQEQNTSKMTTLTGEIDQLCKALEAVKLMLTEN